MAEFRAQTALWLERLKIAVFRIKTAWQVDAYVYDHVPTLDQEVACPSKKLSHSMTYC